jgi:hypothetical protein
MNPKQIEALQRKLAEQGLYTGEIDGVMGRRRRRRGIFPIWERSKQLEVDALSMRRKCTAGHRPQLRASATPGRSAPITSERGSIRYRANLMAELGHSTSVASFPTARCKG